MFAFKVLLGQTCLHVVRYAAAFFLFSCITVSLCLYELLRNITQNFVKKM